MQNPPESNNHQRCRGGPTLSISHRATCAPPLPATWTSGSFSSAAANCTTSRNSPATRAPRSSCLPLPQTRPPRSPLTTRDFAAAGSDCSHRWAADPTPDLFPSGQKLRIAAFSATPGPVTRPRRCQICCYFPPPRDRSSKALRRRGAAERLSNYQLRRYQNELKHSGLSTTSSPVPHPQHRPAPAVTCRPLPSICAKTWDSHLSVSRRGRLDLFDAQAIVGAERSRHVSSSTEAARWLAGAFWLWGPPMKTSLGLHLSWFDILKLPRGWSPLPVTNQSRLVVVQSVERGACPIHHHATSLLVLRWHQVI